MKINLFKKAISESISLKTQLLNSAKLIDKIEKIIYETLKKKIRF